MPKWFHRVLDRDLAQWIDLGWKEIARDRVPSVACDIVIIEWILTGPAKTPTKNAYSDRAVRKEDR